MPASISNLLHEFTSVSVEDFRTIDKASWKEFDLKGFALYRNLYLYRTCISGEWKKCLLDFIGHSVCAKSKKTFFVWLCRQCILSNKRKTESIPSVGIGIPAGRKMKKFESMDCHV
jgi:hypothetical protein